MVVKRMALHIEIFHHGRTVYVLSELKLELALLLSCSHLIRAQDLMPDLVVLLVRIGRDGIFHVRARFSEMLGQC